jgi:hypothetical protein
MALGTNGYTFADLDVAIPEVWGQRINDVYFRNLKLANFFVDRSDELAMGGDTLHTVNGSSYSANTKTNNAEVTLQSPTMDSQNLVVSTWKEASLLFEDREYAQMLKSPALQNSFFTGMAQAVAEDVDSAIAALFSGFSSTVGVSTSNVSLSTLMQALAMAETANVPGFSTGSSDVAFIFHPYTAYAQVGILDNFVSYEKNNSNGAVGQTLYKSVLGVQVIVTSAVPNVSGASGRYNLLAHRDAIHWAKLSFPVKAEKGYVGTHGVRVQESYIHEYLGTLITADICYGVIENRDNAGIKIVGHATFV